MPEAEEVLVVDDHAAIRELVRAVLEGAGYAVREAADGAAALALARRAPPAVILLDLDLPVLDGPGFLAAYRQAPGPHAPVVLMTAAAPAEAARRAAVLGAAGHLSKPFGLAELLAAVGRARAGGAPAVGPVAAGAATGGADPALPGGEPRGGRRRVGRPRLPALARALPLPLPLALLGLLVLLLPAAPAAAQATVAHVNRTFEAVRTSVLPCPGQEPVTVTGTVNVVTQAVTTPAGGAHVMTHFNPQDVTGASASGVPYKGVGVTRTTATQAALSPGETTTFVNVFRLVGPGPGNDLHVLTRTHVTVTPGGEVAVDLAEMERDCR